MKLHIRLRPFDRGARMPYVQAQFPLFLRRLEHSIIAEGSDGTKAQLN
ncbi:MAG TPA: hypothetical protein VFN85_01935 [Solirubrobacterales bacterium]|nr:hypothetical protein [Solirubrobacterales bacterium]